jgi:Aspartate carbamoyltransferase regulatory chain, metal binding domain
LKAEVTEVAFSLRSDSLQQNPTQLAAGASTRDAEGLNVFVAARAINLLGQNRYPVYSQASGIECSNAKCVSRASAERRYLAPRFCIVQQSPPMLRCAFCDVEQSPHAIGDARTRKFTADLADWQDTDTSERMLFADESQAAAGGYSRLPGGRASRRAARQKSGTASSSSQSPTA